MPGDVHPHLLSGAHLENLKLFDSNRVKAITYEVTYGIPALQQALATALLSPTSIHSGGSVEIPYFLKRQSDLGVSGEEEQQQEPQQQEPAQEQQQEPARGQKLSQSAGWSSRSSRSNNWRSGYWGRGDNHQDGWRSEDWGSGSWPGRKDDGQSNNVGGSGRGILGGQ